MAANIGAVTVTCITCFLFGLPSTEDLRASELDDGPGTASWDGPGRGEGGGVADGPGRGEGGDGRRRELSGSVACGLVAATFRS